MLVHLLSLFYFSYFFFSSSLLLFQYSLFLRLVYICGVVDARIDADVGFAFRIWRRLSRLRSVLWSSRRLYLSWALAFPESHVKHFEAQFHVLHAGGIKPLHIYSLYREFESLKSTI